MFGCERKAQATPRKSECRARGISTIIRDGGMGILLAGEEVEVTESEVPGLTGAWCKRETLRIEAERSGNGVLRGHRRQGPQDRGA